MMACVLPVDKDEDDAYAPYNNLNNFSVSAVLLAAGENDENIPLADSKWLYEQLPVRDKQFNSYPSGHSLPVEYVPVGASWFKSRL